MLKKSFTFECKSSLDLIFLKFSFRCVVITASRLTFMAICIITNPWKLPLSQRWMRTGNYDSLCFTEIGITNSNKNSNFCSKMLWTVLSLFLNLSYLNDDIMLRYLNFGALLWSLLTRANWIILTPLIILLAIWQHFFNSIIFTQIGPDTKLQLISLKWWKPTPMLSWKSWTDFTRGNLAPSLPRYIFDGYKDESWITARRYYFLLPFICQSTFFNEKVENRRD